MKDFGPVVIAILGMIAPVIIAFAGGIITMYLFNYLFSTTLLTFVFGFAKIGFWRSVAVNLLIGMGRGVSTTKK